MKVLENLTKWQNYAHYLLLTIGLSAVASYYGAPFDLKMFAILYLSLFLIDTLVHLLFYSLPKPWQWRD